MIYDYEKCKGEPAYHMSRSDVMQFNIIIIHTCKRTHARMHAHTHMHTHTHTKLTAVPYPLKWLASVMKVQDMLTKC